MKKIDRKIRRNKALIDLLNSLEKIVEEDRREVYINLFNSGIILNVKGTLLHGIKTAKEAAKMQKRRLK